MALLALVATAAPQAMPRDRIMAYLWPESDTDRASNSLRQTLFLLRRDLGENLFLTESVNGIYLNPAEISVDLWAFRDAIVRKSAADAAALYAGPFLDGFQLQDAPEYARWMDAERERVERQYIDALETLSREAADLGHYDEEITWRRRQAAVDPFSSRVALGLLRALSAAGDRTGALEYATVYETLIRSHLEIEPDSAVREFVIALRENRVPAILPPRRPALVLEQTPAAVSVTSATAASREVYERPRRERRRWLVAAGIFALLGIAAARPFIQGHAASPASEAVIVVASGMTSVGGRDTATLVIACEGAACPAGPVPQHPFNVPPHPSYTRPATGTSYILPVADGSTVKSPGYRCCTTAVFENAFELPTGAVSATISVAVLADNHASVSINGVEFGSQADKHAQENFTDAATFTATFVPDPSGVNKLRVKLWDGGGVMGLNYRAIITWETGRESASVSAPAQITLR